MQRIAKILFGCLPCLASPASAQTDHTHNHKTRPEIEITPRLHLLSPAGAFHINGSERIPMRFAQLDDQRLAPGWHARVRTDSFHIETEGFVFRIAGRARNAAVLAPSVPITGFARSELEMTAADVRFGWDFYDRRFDSLEGDREVLHTTLSPRVGARLVDLRFSVEDVTTTMLRDESSVTLVEPTVGIAGRLVFEERYELDAAIDLGFLPEIGGVESSSASIGVGLGYHLNESVSFRGGYRLLVQNVTDRGSLELDGSLAGVFVGFSVRF